MEFLDYILTKDSSFTLYAFHRPFFWWRILKKTILYSGFNNPYKKIHETRKLESIHEKKFSERKSEEIKPDKNSSRRRP
jgi:hypothetical protein